MLDWHLFFTPTTYMISHAFCVADSVHLSNKNISFYKLKKPEEKKENEEPEEKKLVGEEEEEKVIQNQDQDQNKYDNAKNNKLTVNDGKNKHKAEEKLGLKKISKSVSVQEKLNEELEKVKNELTTGDLVFRFFQFIIIAMGGNTLSSLFLLITPPWITNLYLIFVYSMVFFVYNFILVRFIELQHKRHPYIFLVIISFLSMTSTCYSVSGALYKTDVDTRIAFSCTFTGNKIDICGNADYISENLVKEKKKQNTNNIFQYIVNEFYENQKMEKGKRKNDNYLFNNNRYCINKYLNNATCKNNFFYFDKYWDYGQTDSDVKKTAVKMSQQKKKEQDKKNKKDSCKSFFEYTFLFLSYTAHISPYLNMVLICIYHILAAIIAGTGGSLVKAAVDSIFHLDTLHHDPNKRKHKFKNLHRERIYFIYHLTKTFCLQVSILSVTTFFCVHTRNIMHLWFGNDDYEKYQDILNYDEATAMLANSFAALAIIPLLTS